MIGDLPADNFEAREEIEKHAFMIVKIAKRIISGKASPGNRAFAPGPVMSFGLNGKSSVTMGLYLVFFGSK